MADDLQGHIGRELANPLQPGVQILALERFHHHVGLLAFDAVILHPRHMSGAERGRRLGLTGKTLERTLVLGQIGAQELDGHR